MTLHLHTKALHVVFVEDTITASGVEVSFEEIPDIYTGVYIETMDETDTEETTEE